jgi:hypothetical protein
MDSTDKPWNDGIFLDVMPRFMPLLSGLDRGDRRDGRRFPDVTPEDRGLRQGNLLGCFRLFVGAWIKSGHDGIILITKHKRHART